MAVSYPYTFVAHTLAESAKVQGNFDYLKTYIDSNMVFKDGSIAFTGQVTGNGADPTADNHLARKAYVDKRTSFLARIVKNSNSNASGTGVTDMGIDMPDWVMPTLGTGQAVRIHLEWPSSTILNQGGFPTQGTQKGELWIRINGTNVQVHDVPMATTSFTPNDNGGGSMEFLIFSNATYTGGTTMTCKIMGRRANPGGFLLAGDASNSIFYYAHVL